jgi:hypothetical protein
MTRVPFELRDDDGVLTPGVDLSAAGVVRVSIDGGATWANRAGGVPTSSEDGVYYYDLHASENVPPFVLVKISKSGFQIVVAREDLATTTLDQLATLVAQLPDDILDAALADHGVIGSVADGIAIAAGLLQGNFFVDQTNNTDPNGQTAARMRVFRDAAATAAATDGGSSEGEFATFVVTTEYIGPNKIKTHRVVRQ